VEDVNSKSDENDVNQNNEEDFDKNVHLIAEMTISKQIKD